MRSLTTLLAGPMLVNAESAFVNGAATGSSASAKLDISIVIQPTLFLRVGSGAALAANDASIDPVTFTVAAANVGDGSLVGGTGSDLSAAATTVRVYGNGGSINLNSATTGPLTNLNGESIPWNQVSVSAAALASATPGFINAAIPHPAFNTGPAGGNGTATTLTAANKVVRVEGRWTYRFLNSNPFPAGTYGATTTRNGRVTYTATQL